MVKSTFPHFSLCKLMTDFRRSFIFTLLTNTLGVAVLSIDGPGKTSLVGVTDLKDVLAEAGAPISAFLFSRLDVR